MDKLTARMRPYRRSIFGEVSREAAARGAINLGQGFPETDGPDELKQAAERAIQQGLGNQYPPLHGLPALRQGIARHQSDFYDLTPDWETGVVVATGASEAIAASLLALVDPGDEVLLLDPYFDLYPAVIALAGGVRKSVPLTEDLRPDPARIESQITDRTRVLLFNSPHNPTGMVATPAEVAALAELAVRHDLIVIADEAYEHLVYEPASHVPIATQPGMWERTVTVGSAGKMFSFTGWKVGWASGPAELIDPVRVVRQHLSFVSSGPFQYAVAEGLTFPRSHHQQLAQQMQAGRDLLVPGLRRLGIDTADSAGTYFATSFLPESSEDFCARMLAEAGIAAIPISALSDHPERTGGWVRWAYCKESATLRTALERLEAWLG